MSLKVQIEQDLKAAMLGGDKVLVTVLRGLKSAILYEEVAKGLRDTGLDDRQIVALFQKEQKKRVESAELYAKGGAPERQQQEEYEAKVIAGYLPQQLGDDDLRKIVQEVIASVGANMGQVIGGVKAKVGASADGARIAKIVKEEL
jgi:uncharacterized protein YqeY